VVLYGLAIPLAFVHQAISDAIYVLVALMWLIPDPRIARTISAANDRERASRGSHG
jgi:hypothetical protein